MIAVLQGGFGLAHVAAELPQQVRPEARVLFAAMIGAQLLAQASGHDDWATALQQVVAQRARKHPVVGRTDSLALETAQGFSVRPEEEHLFGRRPAHVDAARKFKCAGLN